MAKSKSSKIKGQKNRPDESSPEGVKTSSARKSSNKKDRHELGEFPLKKENFVLIIAGFAVVILGYIIMYGTDDIFSFSRMGLPVIIILAGFLIQLYGIMGKPTFLGSNRTENTE